MPRTGWCRECGEWIWLDEQGACEHGHGPDCIDDVQEADPDAEPVTQPAAERLAETSAVPFAEPVTDAPEDPGFGEGEMPKDLNRFNWGAFTLPFFWALVYGAWPVISLWMISLVLPVFLAAIFGIDGTTATLSGLIAVSAAAEVFNGVVRLWAGLNGNRLVWARERRRLELLSHGRPRFTVGRFLTRQRTWSVVGWITLVIAAAGTAVLNAAAWSEYGLEIAGAFEPFVWIAAEVLLGAWLAYKLKQERGSAQTADETQA